jgi:predicted permease
MLNDLRYRTRALFRRSVVEEELDEELRFHLEDQIQKRVRDGIPMEEARRQAHLELGGVEQVKEQCRDQRGLNFLDDLLRDIKYTWRQIQRSHGFFAPAVLLIALGIAVNTQIFALVDAVLLRPLPVRDPGSLVQLFLLTPGRPADPYFEYGFLRRIREHSSTLTGVVGQIELTAPSEHKGLVERVHPHAVTGDYFESLGVSPVPGRSLTSGDEQEAVLSYAFWQRSFGADPKAIGETLHLFNKLFSIVGVAPKSFTGTVIDSSADLWIPQRSSWNLADYPDRKIDDSFIDGTGMEIIGRLRPGVTLAQAQAEASGARNRYLGEIKRDTSQDLETRLEVRSIAHGTSPFRDQASTALWMLLAGAVLLLLMVAANVGSLLLARASAREKETALMLALGASRSRIARLWVTESLILALGGGVLGIWVAWQSLPLWLRWLPPARGIGMDPSEIRVRALDLHPDLRVAAFGISVCVLVALLAGLAPAWRSARSDLWTALKAGIGDVRHRRLQSFLCALQVALCTLLLIFATLMARTLSQLRATNMGFEPLHVAIFTVDPNSARYTKEQDESLQRRLLDGAKALPGVEATAIARRALMRGIGLGVVAIFPGRPSGARLNSSINEVSPGYFETMGIGILSGHGFDSSDLTAVPKGKLTHVVVNQAFVRRFFPDGRAIGQVFATGRTWLGPAYEIIAVVKDTKYRSLREVPPATIYLPAVIGPRPFLNPFVLHVRTRGDPGETIPAVRKLLASIDSRLSFYEVATLAEEIDRSLWQERMLVALASAFGVFAVVLAGIGLYGILAYYVAGRRGEMGMRIALGALPADIGRLLLKQLVPTIVIGLGAGIALSLAAGTSVKSLLYDVAPYDPRAAAAALGTMLLIVFVAMAVPTWRVLRIDPASALRQE